jgi:hypothetical protein
MRFSPNTSDTPFTMTPHEAEWRTTTPKASPALRRLRLNLPMALTSNWERVSGAERDEERERVERRKRRRRRRERKSGEERDFFFLSFKRKLYY